MVVTTNKICKITKTSSIGKGCHGYHVMSFLSVKIEIEKYHHLKPIQDGGGGIMAHVKNFDLRKKIDPCKN